MLAINKRGESKEDWHDGLDSPRNGGIVCSFHLPPRTLNTSCVGKMCMFPTISGVACGVAQQICAGKYRDLASRGSACRVSLRLLGTGASSALVRS
eukprot:6189652-Pleurochrysis_carterae.AAC.1